MSRKLQNLPHPSLTLTPPYDDVKLACNEMPQEKSDHQIESMTNRFNEFKGTLGSNRPIIEYFTSLLASP